MADHAKENQENRPSTEGQPPDEVTKNDAQEAARAMPSYTPQARDDQGEHPNGPPSFTPMGQTDNEEP